MRTHHVAWSSLGLLPYVVETLRLLSEQSGDPQPTIRYRTKIKQHGTNCAVQVRRDGEHVGVFAQGRTDLLTPEADYKGFAKWVRDNEERFRAVPGEDLTIFGEWAGPGVEPGMAVSKVEGRMFFVFAVQVGRGEGASLIYDPDVICQIITPAAWAAGLVVLPWEEPEVTIDFADSASVEAAARAMSAVVLEVEREDPFVKRVLGISGTGEGLVFYPVGEVPSDPERYCQLMWKAKGDKHATVRQRAPVQAAPEVVASVAAFVDLMVTEPRLLQGVTVACGGVYDPKLTGKFISWLSGDVQKESTAELGASGLSWAQVQRAVETCGRQWYLNRAKPA